MQTINGPGKKQYWSSLYYLFKNYINLFLERGREGERETERCQSVVASRTPPSGDLA